MCEVERGKKAEETAAGNDLKGRGWDKMPLGGETAVACRAAAPYIQIKAAVCERLTLC